MNKDRILEGLKKTTYIIQYIITLIFSVFLLKLTITKTVSGFFDKAYLIFTVLFGIVMLAFMIYHIKVDGKKVEKMFLNFAFLLGMLYIVFLVPGQVPDEQVHMMKAYEISNGIFVTPIKEDGSSNITMPEDLLKYNHNLMKNYQKVQEELDNNTDYNKTAEDVSSAQGYSSIMYLIPAAGLFIARTLGLNLITGIYLGKILNLLFFIIMGFFAIKKIPFGKIFASVYLLMPMMLHQAASFSADAFINAIVIYFIAYVLDLLCKEEKISKKELIIYCILSVLLSIAKIAYMPLVGMGVLLFFKKNISKKDKIIFVTLSIILSVSFTAIEYIHANQYTSQPQAMKEYSEMVNINSSKQIGEIIQNPVKTAIVFVKDWASNGGMYITDAIGKRLGWLNIEVPVIYILGYFALLICSIFIEKNEKMIKLSSKIWLQAICIGILLLVQLALYISSTPVGANFVGGVQGRYFIPILIVQMLCFAKKDNYIKVKHAETIPVIAASIINILTMYNIYSIFK